MTSLIRQLALVSESKEVPLSDLLKVSSALQKQVTRDLASVWDIGATVDAFEKLEDVPIGYWPLIVLDDIGEPGAAGIHEDKNGQPFALIEASTNLDVWSLTASHEAIEMLVDPYGNHLVPGDSPMPNQGRVCFLVEVCDPCEAADFAYTVNGVLVSDFYTPNYFDPMRHSSAVYSYTGAVTEPRQVLPGGYLSWRDEVSNHWFQEIWFDTNKPAFRDLGPIDQRATGNIRSVIDRMTMVDTMKALSRGRKVATAAGVSHTLIGQASTSQAQMWRKRIGEIVSQTRKGPVEKVAELRPAPRVRISDGGEAVRH